MTGYIITIIVAIFGSTGFWSWLSGRRTKKDGASKLLLGLAYRSIIESSEQYIRRGWIAVDEYDELNRYLYEPYKALGGDGTAQKLMEEVKRLPTKKEEEK